MNLEQALKRIDELEEQIRVLTMGVSAWKQLVDAIAQQTPITPTWVPDQGVWCGGAGQH